MSERYRTIVADPPWNVGRGPDWASNGASRPLAYETMTLDDIASLPVADIAERRGAHLYVWTINAYIEQTYEIARAWGFKPSTLLTWCKPPNGLGLGGAYSLTTEQVLFARRGVCRAKERIDTSWFSWPRREHSAKPEAFLDMVERVSPGPYAELFARRARFGWEYPIGDQALGGRAFEPAVRPQGRPLDGGKPSPSGRREIPTVSPTALNSDTLADGTVAGSDEDRGEDAA